VEPTVKFKLILVFTLNENSWVNNKIRYILCCDTESGCGYNLNTTCKLGYASKKVMNFDNFFLMLVFYDVQLCTGLRLSPKSYGLLNLWHGQCPKYQSHPLQDTITRILCGWISNCTWILEGHMESTGFSQRF
jgi:hypothetical protein